MKRSLFVAFAVTLALTAALGVVLTASAGGITFGTKTDYATETYSYFRRLPNDLVTSDFNRDGKLDLAVVNQGGGATGNYASYPGSLLIFTGDGDGAFTRTFTFTVGSMAPMAMAAADFNQDGKLDLGVAMSNTHGVNTFLGDGAGAFTLAYTTTLSTLKPTALAVGDFNKDGRPDLIVGAENSTGSGNARVLLNNAAGFTVSTVTLSSNMWNPKNVAVGDFNQDGNADFVIVPDQGNLDVLQGNGAGGFSLLTSLGAGSNPIGAATSDLNADGYLDLVLGTSANVAPSYFLGRSGGIDPGSHSYGSNTKPLDVAIADINGDGVPDILASTEVYVNSSWQYGFDVFAGVGDGAFGAPSHFLIGSRPTKFAIGDFDRDGKPDVAMANQGQGTISIVLNKTTWKSFAGFNSAVNYDTGSAFSYALSQGDFTGDGKPDLVAGQLTGQTLRHYRGSANGAFAISQTLTSLGEIKGSAAGDFNRDGRLDLALARQDGRVQILTNTVASNLTAGPTYVVDAARLGGVAAGDLNGDGALDLVATVPGNDNANRIGVLLNKGTGVFSPTVTYTVEAAPGYVALADFDGDGRLDVAVSNYVSNTVSLLLNTGAGVLGTPTTITGTNQATGLVAQDFDRDGDMDLAVGGNGRLDLLLNDGAGGFPAADRKTRIMPTQIGPLVAADINRDGILDLLAGAFQTSAAPVAVVMGVGDGTFGESTVYTGTSDTLRVPDLVVGDYNRDGGPDLAFVQPVSASPFTQLSTRLSQLLEPPTITSANSATFTVDSMGIFTFTATGDPTVTNWSRAGIMPGGVTFVTTTVGAATLAGAPAAGSGGLYALVFTATNGVPPDATQSFTLTVTEAPAITSAAGYTFTLGQFGAFTVTVSGYPTPTVALSAGALPTGVSFNPATKVISGTPAAGALGVYTLTFTAANGLSPNAVQPFTLTVSGPQVSLTKSVMPASEVRYQAPVTYTLVLANHGSAADPSVRLTDTLPADAPFAAWVEQPADAQQTGNQLTWEGAVAAGAAVTFTFQATNTLGGAAVITNTAYFSGMLQTGSATAIYSTTATLTPSGSGAWSAVFPPCAGVCKYLIPAGVTVTLDIDLSLAGDMEVQGAFIPGTRTVTLAGSQPQTLTGNPLTFYNLRIEKSAKTDTVTIAGKLKVTKKLTIMRGKLVSASEYEDVEIETDGELALTSPITITGSFTNSGELTTNGHAVIFAGGKTQHLTLNVLTMFDDLVVGPGVTLVEMLPEFNNAYVGGALTNQGVIRKTQPVTTTGVLNLFGLAGWYNSADLEIDVTTQGALSSIQVDRIDGEHPSAPAGAISAIYWTITGVGDGYTVDLTLPHAGLTSPTSVVYLDWLNFRHVVWWCQRC